MRWADGDMLNPVVWGGVFGLVRGAVGSQVGGLTIRFRSRGGPLTVVVGELRQ